jgi:hypothetical protein
MIKNGKLLTLDGIDSLFLKLFRITLLVIMSLALLGTIGTLIYSAKLYFQDAKEINQDPPSNRINLKGLIDELEKKSLENEGKKIEVSDSDSTRALKYLEEVTKLFRCSQAFAGAVGAVVVEAGSEAASKDIENLRQQIESLASKKGRGDPFVKDLVDFSCSALQSNEIVKLRKGNKIQGVFLGILNYHVNAWDQILLEREAATLKENARILKDRDKAVYTIQLSAALFLIFMILAFYLIFAKIELSLRKETS